MINHISYLERNKWEKLAVREVSLFEVMCAARAYLLLPEKLDSVLIARNGIATRYVPLKSLKRFELAIQNTDAKQLMTQAKAGDDRLRTFLDGDSRKDIGTFINLYINAWRGELAGFYIGHFSRDSDAQEVAVSMRGTQSGQHIAAVDFVPKTLNSVAAENAVPKELAKYILPEEVQSNVVHENELRERQSLYVVFAIADHILLFTGEKAAEISRFLEKTEKEIKRVDSFTGQVGNKGRATGIVRIVNSLEEGEKVREGDILVSVMTRTNLIQPMQRAAAFVTDEGGVTCHAAIVARELKKPCVIGTKIATKVLKDGDFVEVDAGKGVVRILSK